MPARLKATMILDSTVYEKVLGPETIAELSRLLDLDLIPRLHADIVRNPLLLAETEVLISGWGAPRFDEDLLNLAPRLQAIFYAAGAMGGALTPAVWERGIVVTSANEINAIPVAEFTLATVLFSLKHGWRLIRETRQRRTFADRDSAIGAYQSSVGLVSMGAIARKVAQLLKPFDLHIMAYDPFISPQEAAELGVELVSLEALFERSDVVSIHTPSLPETLNMIDRPLLERMKPGATFINTARPSVVKQDDLLDVARRRADLQFVLDVVDPEPPEADSPFYTMENITLTPHMAGSVGRERLRMGRFILDEVQRFLAGEALQGEVTPQVAKHSAHRPTGVSVEAFVNIDGKFRRAGSARFAETSQNERAVARK